VAVLAIYQAGIDTGNATFETTAPNWDAFDAGRLPGHCYVAADGAEVIASWIAVTAVLDHPATHGNGVGTALLAALIASTGAVGIWTI
jgi:L-amino acid N-acyltransferase YncA